MALQVHWLQQQLATAQLSPRRQQQEQQRQQQQQAVLSVPKQMPLWELSRGGSSEFQASTHDVQLRWQQLLKRCCAASARQLGQIHLNANNKAELLDPLDWQLGSYYEPSPAHSGFQDTPF
jgi:hypothetical protein